MQDAKKKNKKKIRIFPFVRGKNEKKITTTTNY